MRALFPALVATAGCFASPGGGDDICPLAGDVAFALRDPSTGQCESFGGGCRGIPYPDWASCNGSCEQLGEAACLRTADCRAIYAGSAQLHSFIACWGTAPSSHQAGGDCTKLDPYQCSEHDDCSALFAEDKTPPMTWVSCLAERALLDPGTCDGQVLCRAQPPACPGGTVPGIANGCYSGYCIPSPACGGPLDPGTCDGAVCAVVGPACPAGTQPGVLNGCYSGYCIPDAACDSR